MTDTERLDFISSFNGALIILRSMDNRWSIWINNLKSKDIVISKSELTLRENIDEAIARYKSYCCIESEKESILSVHDQFPGTEP